MRKNTDGKSWRGAVLSAVVIAVPALVLAGLFLAFALGVLDADGEGFAAGLLALYGLVLLAVVIGVFAALRQRRKELQRGEEDEAKKY